MGRGVRQGKLSFTVYVAWSLGIKVKLNKIRIYLTLHILHGMSQVLTCWKLKCDQFAVRRYFFILFYFYFYL